jgi:predicted GNAT family N-acyltransferase
LAEQDPKLDFKIEPLNDHHDRAAFSCGDDDLDRYLQKQAGQDVKKRVAAVFVASVDGKTIAGFYTLSAHMLHLNDVPMEAAKKLPKYPNVPATLLGRLARSKNLPKQGLGEFLLMDALRKALDGSRTIASAAVVVDAKSEAAREFYEDYDFIRLPQQPMRLYYPMHTIAKLFPADAPEI